MKTYIIQKREHEVEGDPVNEWEDCVEGANVPGGYLPPTFSDIGPFKAQCDIMSGIFAESSEFRIIERCETIIYSPGGDEIMKDFEILEDALFHIGAVFGTKCGNELWDIVVGSTRFKFNKEMKFIGMEYPRTEITKQDPHCSKS